MSIKIEFISSGGITTPKGYFAGATCAGIKRKAENALDLGILFSEKTCNAAAIFTTNCIKAAPVLVSKKKLTAGKASAFLVNSGCANACTGEKGMADAEATAEAAANALGVSADHVLVASTGVIGVALPVENIKEGIERIALSREGGHELARAIMTTDTHPKEIAVKVTSRGSSFTIGGIAKGSGMIHPELATMLSFLTTDADVTAKFLQSTLKKVADISYNMVSIDGDTSTNDMVLLMANGMAGNRQIVEGSFLAEAFEQALNKVCIFLAKSIARDGEGATRLIEVNVNGALDEAEARLASKTMVSSSLVKSAVHGCDPNWGRIIAAAGRSGARIEEQKTDLYIGNICMMKSGIPVPFDKKEASGLLSREEVPIRLELNLGNGSATAWGCDLSEEYVKINSEYTT